MIGEENQTCPKLILGGEHPVPEGVTVDEAHGNRFTADPPAICFYLGSTYGVGIPHD